MKQVEKGELLNQQMVWILRNVRSWERKSPMRAPKFHVPPLTPGTHTIAELFTVTGDEALKAFDVAQLSEDLVVKIGITILQRIDADTLNQAVEACNPKLFHASIANFN